MHYELERVFHHFSNYYIKLFRNFNAKIDKENTFKPKFGKILYFKIVTTMDLRQ